jgi:hypothetical protein
MPNDKLLMIGSIIVLLLLAFGLLRIGGTWKRKGNKPENRKREKKKNMRPTIPTENGELLVAVGGTTTEILYLAFPSGRRIWGKEKASIGRSIKRWLQDREYSTDITIRNYVHPNLTGREKKSFQVEVRLAEPLEESLAEELVNGEFPEGSALWITSPYNKWPQP